MTVTCKTNNKDTENFWRHAAYSLICISFQWTELDAGSTITRTGPLAINAKHRGILVRTNSYRPFMIMIITVVSLFVLREKFNRWSWNAFFFFFFFNAGMWQNNGCIFRWCCVREEKDYWKKDYWKIYIYLYKYLFTSLLSPMAALFSSHFRY